jgi:hypothetical protein
MKKVNIVTIIKINLIKNSIITLEYNVIVVRNTGIIVTNVGQVNIESQIFKI